MFPNNYFPATMFAPRYFPPRALTLAEILDLDFDVRRGYEGLQLVINWGLPGNAVATELRLLRKEASFPENVDDGVLVVSDTTPFTVNSFSDREISEFRVYYYQLFVFTFLGAFETTNSLRDKEFPIPTGFFEEKLFSLFPNVYQREDGEG